MGVDGPASPHPRDCGEAVSPGGPAVQAIRRFTPGLCFFSYSTHTSIRLEETKTSTPSGYETPGGRGRVSAQGQGAQGSLRAGQGALSPTAQQRGQLRTSPAHLDQTGVLSLLGMRAHLS